MFKYLFASCAIFSLYSADFVELPFFNKPNGCYNHTLKQSKYFNPQGPAHEQFHIALNIFHSHERDQRLTEEQKNDYNRVITLIKNFGSLYPAEDTHLVKNLIEYKPQITQYRPETSFARSRKMAITSTWRGFYAACKQKELNMPTFTDQLRNALSLLERSCGGMQLSNPEKIRSLVQANDFTQKHIKETRKKTRKRPAGQSTIEQYFKKQK